MNAWGTNGHETLLSYAARGVAAELHMAAVAPNMPYIEFPMASPDSPLISRLLTPSLEAGPDGTIEVPKRPGLGFELDGDILYRYRVDPC